MINPESYFREASRLQCEATSTCSRIVRRGELSGKRSLVLRETLPSGCILYTLPPSIDEFHPVQPHSALTNPRPK